MLLASALLVAHMVTDYMQPVAASTVPTTTTHSAAGAGDLTITLENQGVVGSIARGATRVELFTANISASCDADVRLDGIDVKHVGLGSLDDVSRVYFSDNFRRLTRAVAFERSGGVARLRFSGLTVPKCGSVRMTLLADFSTTASVAGEHGATIASSSAVHSGAASVTIAAAEKLEVKVTAPKQSGVITVNLLPITSRLRYGRIETVARLQLSADNQSDHLLKKITFTNDESARDMDLVNFQIETLSGKPLTNVAARMRGKEVALEFTPSYVLKRSTTVVLLLKAEVRASVTRKVKFILEEPSDLDAKVYYER